MLDFHFRIAQVEYRGQTRYTRILDRQNWLTSIIAFDMDWTHWSWNIFFFALFSSSRSSTSAEWKARTWNLEQIFKTELLWAYLLGFWVQVLGFARDQIFSRVFGFRVCCNFLILEALSILVQHQKWECSFVERNSENPASCWLKNGFSASAGKILSNRGKIWIDHRVIDGLVNNTVNDYFQ